MLFKRKQKNRKHERAQVLQVKLRSQHTRALRLRLAATALAIGVGTVTGVFVLWRSGEWLLDELVFHNPTFAIQKIEVTTDGIIPPQVICAWAGVKTGDNLFRIDLGRVSRDLELVSLIKSASAERVPPATLKLRVMERKPVAQLTFFESRSNGTFAPVLLFIDDQGYVLRPLPNQQPPGTPLNTISPLPSLAGVSWKDVRPGQQVESRQILAAIEFIQVFERSPMAGLVDLKSIDVSRSGVLDVATWQNNVVTFPLNRFERCLHRWRVVQNYASQLGRAIGSLDLSVANNAPVRWRETSGAVPSNGPAQSSRNRRKHV